MPKAQASQSRQSTSTEKISSFLSKVLAFHQFNTSTTSFDQTLDNTVIPFYINEFWTSKQRAAHSIQEISYRACFKPQLPRFFIEGLSSRGNHVYDPFMGRGTTVIEAAHQYSKSLLEYLKVTV